MNFLNYANKKSEDAMWHNLDKLEDTNSSISSQISSRITVSKIMT